MNSQQIDELFAKAVAIPSEVLINQVADESVLLNLDGGRYFGLDNVATDMWKALTNCPTVQAAYERLLTEFEVEPATLRHDLALLIDQLVEQRLITLVNI